jgi:hypothetical protein
MIDAEKSIEGVYERALRSTRTGKFGRDAEPGVGMRYVCAFTAIILLDALKNPLPRARVGPVEPRSDHVIKDVGIATVADSKEESCEVIEDTNEAV